MELQYLHTFFWCLGAAVLGGVLFSLIGLISGTSETATIAPATLLVILVGFPPAAAFSFCMAAVASKHLIHAVPTAILGVPGDNMAIPMLEPSATLRSLGAPHIALQKMVSGGVLALVLGIPISVGFATLLAPFGDMVKAWVGPIFTVVAIGIAYTSKGKWASVFMVLPFALILQAFDKVALSVTGHGLVISYMLGMALGPMFVDLVTALSPVSRSSLVKNSPAEFWLAPELKTWSGYLPNPWKILTGKQKGYVLIATIVSAMTFTFSPVGMTFIIGQAVESRINSLYDKLTTTLAVMNATTESTYLAEILIPLIAFGVPLSPIAMTVTFPLFNAPPVFTTQPMHNIHTLMTPLEIGGYAMLAVLVGAMISYPLAMNYARRASAWVLRCVSQEAILTMFAGLVVVLSFYEGGWLGVAMAMTIGAIGGMLNKFFGFNIGVQMMSLYASGWIVLQLFGVK
ncbi:MAG: tripartite tricarboxylate transporter permease [Negativicutes bacterium]|nr:tripartite tricarboxylate transporter permease [Negativicutes bacterium]